MSTLDSWGARLTRWRDIALVGFASVYALGYLTRAVHAWLYNLGVLPGVELQYFVAGLLLFLPPAALLALLYGVWRGFQGFAAWERRRPGVRQRIDTSLGVVVLVALLGFVAIDWLRRWLPIPPHVSNILLTVFVGGFAINIGLGMARPATPPAALDAERHDHGVLVRVFEWIGRVLGGILAVNIGLFFVTLLATSILVGALKLLPELPQALGGAAPRCAMLDVDVAKVSPELAAELFGKDAAQAPSVKGARRSREVRIYYSGGDYLLFKLPAETSAAATTYELKRSAVEAVLWCQ
jgi:hypothetical protein